jgi:hypothetical protein
MPRTPATKVPRQKSRSTSSQKKIPRESKLSKPQRKPLRLVTVRRQKKSPSTAKLAMAEEPLLKLTRSATKRKVGQSTGRSKPMSRLGNSRALKDSANITKVLTNLCLPEGNTRKNNPGKGENSYNDQLIEVTSDSGSEDLNEQGTLGKRVLRVNTEHKIHKSVSRHSASPSPLRSILKTSPMYSPIKSTKNKTITIAEQFNRLKNFDKGSNIGEPSKILAAAEKEIFGDVLDVQEIVQTSTIHESTTPILPGKTVLKPKILASKFTRKPNLFDIEADVEYSTMKPTYVTHQVPAITIAPARYTRASSPARYIHPDSPRIPVNPEEDIAILEKSIQIVHARRRSPPKFQNRVDFNDVKTIFKSPQKQKESQNKENMSSNDSPLDNLFVLEPTKELFKRSPSTRAVPDKIALGDFEEFRKEMELLRHLTPNSLAITTLLPQNYHPKQTSLSPKRMHYQQTGAHSCSSAAQENVRSSSPRPQSTKSVSPPPSLHNRSPSDIAKAVIANAVTSQLPSHFSQISTSMFEETPPKAKTPLNTPSLTACKEDVLFMPEVVEYLSPLKPRNLSPSLRMAHSESKKSASCQRSPTTPSQPREDLELDIAGKLSSKHPMDVHHNAKLLLEILKNFSVSFDLPVVEVLSITSRLQNSKSSLSIDELRQSLIHRATRSSA